MWTNTDEAVAALLSAIKAVCGVVAANDELMGKRLTTSFDKMAQEYLNKRNPDGVVVMHELRSHIENRAAAQALYDVEPQGRG